MKPTAPSGAQQSGQNHIPSAVKPSADESDQRWYAPEIWRLPPVNGPQSPPALTMPPAETIPAPTPSAFPPAANAPATLSGVLSIDEPIKIKPSKPEVDKLWDGSFDLGLDGSEGNSETFNFRFGFHASRKTESNILTLGLDYNKRTAQTVPTADRLFFDGRFEWLIADSRWSWFVHETIEYDEFQTFDVRDTSDAGLGYRLIKNENTTFIGRIGSGFSHEYGGPENGQYIPEVVFGLQLERQIGKRQKILGAVEYAPGVGDFDRYRIRTQAALEVLLDEERNLSLRMGVLERYNSRPNGALPNDLDYALVVIWKF
jgi:putative salt-induced outer membrane protein YdiY